MNKTSLVSLCGLLLMGTFFANAGEKLDEINAEVEKQAAQIDHDYGVLLTSQELDDLKISLIVDKENKEQPNASVVEKTKSAIKTYEITDPANQRKLLIELGVNEGDGGGLVPPSMGEDDGGGLEPPLMGEIDGDWNHHQ